MATTLQEILEHDLKVEDILCFSQLSASKERGFNVYSVLRLTKGNLGIKKHYIICASNECLNYVEQLRTKFITECSKRPQSLLVFINPHGGTRQAEYIYENDVKPIFELIGINVKTVVTKSKGYCSKYLLTEDLSTFDGIIAVGGDGMYSEVVYGVMLRMRKDAGLPLHECHFSSSLQVAPKIPIGIIPAGSTNTVAWSLHGTDDVVTAVLHIVFGNEIATDISSVYDLITGEFLRYTTSLLGYGFNGDLLKHSERLRWMGPFRYNVTGFLSFIKHRSYDGEIFFLPSNSPQHPLDGRICSNKCTVCSSIHSDSPPITFPTLAIKQDEFGCYSYSSNSNVLTIGSVKPLTHIFTNCLPSTRFCDGGIYQNDDTSNLIDSPIPSATISGDSTSRVTGGEAWRSIRGSFLSVNAFVLPCRCSLLPLGAAPSAHLGDGCMDLVVVHSCSRLQYLRFLLASKSTRLRAPTAAETASGSVLSPHLDMPFVDVHRVRAFFFMPSIGRRRAGCSAFWAYPPKACSSCCRLKADDAGTSVWCVDGEVLEGAGIFSQVHRKLIRIFSRGSV